MAGFRMMWGTNARTRFRHRCRRFVRAFAGVFLLAMTVGALTDPAYADEPRLMCAGIGRCAGLGTTQAGMTSALGVSPTEALARLRGSQNANLSGLERHFLDAYERHGAEAVAIGERLTAPDAVPFGQADGLICLASKDCSATGFTQRELTIWLGISPTDAQDILASGFVTLTDAQRERLAAAERFAEEVEDAKENEDDERGDGEQDKGLVFTPEEAAEDSLNAEEPGLTFTEEEVAKAEEGLTFSEEEVVDDAEATPTERRSPAGARQTDIPIAFVDCGSFFDTDGLGTLRYTSGPRETLSFPRIAVELRDEIDDCPLTAGGMTIVPAQTALRSTLSASAIAAEMEVIRKAAPRQFRQHVPTASDLESYAPFRIETPVGRTFAYTHPKQSSTLRILIPGPRKPYCYADEPCIFAVLHLARDAPWAPKTLWPPSRDLATENDASLDDDAFRQALLCGAGMARFCRPWLTADDIRLLLQAEREEIAATVMDAVSDYPWSGDEEAAVFELWQVFRNVDLRNNAERGFRAGSALDGAENETDALVERLREKVEEAGAATRARERR